MKIVHEQETKDIAGAAAKIVADAYMAADTSYSAGDLYRAGGGAATLGYRKADWRYSASRSIDLLCLLRFTTSRISSPPTKHCR